MMPLFDWLLVHLGARKVPRPKSERVEGNGHGDTSCKWLPVISQNYCTGCSLCVKACEHECLGLVWDFATLQRPQDCHSDGKCVEACPEGCIQMDWLPVSEEKRVGSWREAQVSKPT